MSEAKSTCRVGISGSYGGMNLGDEAILKSIVKQLRDSLDVEITVFSRYPDDTLKRHKVERAVSARDLTRDEARAEVERLDVLVLGGGGILYDRDVEFYLREVALAHEVGVPVMVYAISAGPLTTTPARRSVREELNKVAVLTVRDRLGKRLLEDVGVEKEVHITADPALLMEPEPLPPEALKREGLDTQRRLVGFSVREPGPAAPDMDVDHYHGLIANAADFVVERFDADVVFVPMERKHMDVQHSHAVVAKMQAAPRATVLRGEYTSGQIVSLMSSLRFAVGMRLHFLIFAALQEVPFVALPYASKVTGFLEDMKMEMPPMAHFNAGQLVARIDRCWDQQDVLRQRIREALPELKDRARRTHEMLLELLGQKAAAAN